MIAAAADAVAQLSDATRPGAGLLPPVSNLRAVSAAVAIAVAEAAENEGLARVRLDPVQQVHEAMWRPSTRGWRRSRSDRKPSPPPAVRSPASGGRRCTVD